MEFPKRKSPRLQGYDYSKSGAYFITICTYQKQKLLSKISVGRALAPAENILTECGKCAEHNLLLLESRYPCMSVDRYVIMPNHIHAILFLHDTAGASARPTISDIIRTYKSLTSRACKSQFRIAPLFQNSFHDHIIRTENDYIRIAEYIIDNPAKWCDDCFYVN